MTENLCKKKGSEISFDPLCEKHFSIIHKWFNLPHVKKFYSLRDWNIEEIGQKLTPYLEGARGMKCYVVFVKSDPVGYVQSYPVKLHPWDNQNLSENVIHAAAGIDLFIGEKGTLAKDLVVKF